MPPLTNSLGTSLSQKSHTFLSWKIPTNYSNVYPKTWRCQLGSVSSFFQSSERPASSSVCSMAKGAKADKSWLWRNSSGPILRLQIAVHQPIKTRWLCNTRDGDGKLGTPFNYLLFLLKLIHRFMENDELSLTSSHHC
jgi:hypothetical protein